MGLNKDFLVYDPSEDAVDSVGAYLRSSDGTLLTHTTLASKEALDVNIAGSDIQIDVDLVHTEDSIRLGDGTAFFTSTSENGDIALDVHISNSDLDIRDLTHASDSVKIGDGTDFLAINTDGSMNVNSTAIGFTGCANSAISVSSTATDLLATDLVNRKSITIQNLGTKDIFIGCDNTVTTANGVKIPRGGSGEFKMGAGIDVHAITAAGTADVRILEFS